MEYSIYVFGGGEILWKVFNGIALLFGSDTPYFTVVGKITIAIGLIFVAARAIPSASLPLFFRSWFLPTFLLIGLFFGLKSSVHIIDKVDSNFQYSKVDNIPVGIAVVASLCSHIGEYLTETVETVFVGSDSERFSKVGSMFGAKLMHSASELTIKDPLMRENLKDFTRQCFAWPYVFSNLEPGKKAALETEDMLGFIEANPHPLLGIYWREQNGQARFLNCRECSLKVREIIPIEIDSGLQSLASKIFNTQRDPEMASRRLHQYFGDAWHFLSKGSGDAAQVIQQQLMLNSYRGALKDKRDELGLGRFNGELTQLNAERGQAYQDSSFLVKAALSGAQIPVIHTIIFALALIYFAVMAPMTFLPGGMSLMVTWVKVMMWLASWPVLFTILNALGHLFAAQATSSQLIGYGQGLNLMTQNGLAEASFNAYCFVMGLQYSVPFIAWALLWGGGYAFTQLSSSFTQTGESFAGKAGSEMVDGNVSFDTQTMHSRSIANSQMAQQQLGASFNYGQRFDDGKMATLHGAGGQVTLQEHLTNLGTNVSQNDTASMIAGIQSQMSLQSSYSKQKQAGEQVQMGTNELFSLVKSASTSKGFTESFGDSKSSNIQKSFSNARDIAEKYAADHHISEDKAFNILLGASAGIDRGTRIGKIGAIIKGDIGGQMQSSAKNNESISHHDSSGIVRQFSNSLNEGLQYLEDYKGSINDSSLIQKMDQVQHHFNQAKNYSDQANLSLQESKMWSESSSLQRQKGISSGSNINDQVLSDIADKRFGGDKSAAASWQSQNPSSYQKDVETFLEQRQLRLQSNRSISKGSVQEHSAKMMDKISSIPYSNSQVLKLRQEYNLAKQEQAIDEKITDHRLKMNRNIEGYELLMDHCSDTHNAKISQEEKKQKLEEESNKYLISKAYHKMVK